MNAEKSDRPMKINSDPATSPPPSTSASMRFWRLRAAVGEKWRRLVRKKPPAVKGDHATFLIPHHNSAEFIDACLHAVRRHHPDSRIIVADCASLRDQYLGACRACERHKAELHTGWLRHGHTGQLEYLLSLADTEVAVFLDQDCVLLRPLTPLFDHLRQGKLLVGPRDFMTLDHPRFVSRFPQLRGKPMRFGRNFIHASLMVTSPAGIRAVTGRRPFYWRSEWDAEYTDGGARGEKYYGLCRQLRMKKPGSILPLEHRHTSYGKGVVYLHDEAAVAYHNWYSSSVRHWEGQFDLVDVSWLRDEAKRFLDDYWNEALNFELPDLLP
jgi:hypothetical protein